MSEIPTSQVYEVAVVGSVGFLGGAVTRQLDSASIPWIGFTLDRLMFNLGVIDPEALGVSTVIWCASRINPKLAADNPELIDLDKADLREAIAEFTTWDRPPRIVTFSSGGTIYGPPAVPPYRESDEPAPVNAYGQAKLELEQILHDSPLESVALRVANAYGPGQRPAPGQGVIAHWMEAVLAEQPLQLFGHPDDTRDYVYVDDIARAAVAAHRAVAPDPVVNIGSGKPTTLDDLVDALAPAVAPRQLSLVRHPPRATDTPHSTLDISLAKSCLGWEPLTDLNEGIAAQWAWRLAQ